MAPWLPWVSAAAIITIHRTFGSVAGGEGEFKEAAGTSKDRDGMAESVAAMPRIGMKVKATGTTFAPNVPMRYPPTILATK